MDELDKIDHSDQSDASTSLAHQLKEVAGSSKMSDTIIKCLVNAPPPTLPKLRALLIGW